MVEKTQEDRHSGVQVVMMVVLSAVAMALAFVTSAVAHF